MPKMLREIIVSSLSGQDDIEISGEATAVEKLPELLQLSHADVVVLGCGDAEVEDTGRALLKRAPHTCLLAITGGGRHLVQYRHQPRRLDLGEASPSVLLESIRECARQLRALR